MKNIKQFELKANKTDFQSVQIKSSEDAYNYIKQFYSDDLEIYESFFIFITE